MNYLQNAIRYHSLWMEVSPETLDLPGVHLVCSSERDHAQAGYSSRFDVYCLLRGDCAVISYSERLEQRVKSVARSATHTGPNGLQAALADEFGLTACSSSVKFSFIGLPEGIDTSGTRQLLPEEYTVFLDFFKACHPNANIIGWLEDYFHTIAHKGMCWGVFKEGKLASVVDLSDIPYMQDTIYELGINTRPDCRRQGYAHKIAGAAISHALALGMTPIWSTAADNLPSKRLAQSLGFVEFGEVYTISLCD